MKKLITKNKNILSVTFLCLFSLIFNLYYGYIGVFPIDSFIIFDASYNILLGNHPFRDYWSITGPLLDYIQSFFFLIFGINWFSYVLHASFLNLLLALFSFHFFLKIKLRTFYAFIYSLGVSILAYPSVGSPFMDHHAVIFSVMTLYSLSLGILLKKNYYWFLIPVFLVFSFFSKQIPSAYLLLLITIIVFFYFIKIEDFKSKNLLFLIYGSIFSILLIFSVLLINEIPTKDLLLQYIFYPSSLGSERINSLNIDFSNLIAQFKFIYLSLIPLTISSFFLVKIKNKNLLHKKEIIVSILFIISIIIFIYSQLLTKNQILIFFLISIITGISHSYTIKYFNNKYLIYFIIFIFIFSNVKYHIRFNENKKFMELSQVDLSLAVDAKLIDERLSKLKWITPDYNNQPDEEIKLLKEAKNILLESDKNKVLITDYQFFSSLLNNKFTSPNKWYDELSVPSKKNKHYNSYKNFFIAKLREQKIKYLYFIGKDKHEMLFFREFINENKCIISKKYNELLIEFDMNKCRF